MKNALLQRGLWLAGFVLLLGISVAAYGFSHSSERADCPGKVACPLTGDEVCKDQCPLVDADRADCPGKIECALTGELVCEDKCPLGAEGAVEQKALPACCSSAP